MDSGTVNTILTAIATTLITQFFLPSIKQWYINKNIKVTTNSMVGNRVSVNVINNSSYPVSSVCVYLSLNNQQDDILSEPENTKAYITPDFSRKIEEERLCWSGGVSKDKINPPEVDIYAGELKRLDLFAVDLARQCLEIPSEQGWGSEYDKKETYSTAFLTVKTYSGKLKIISKETVAKEVAIEIDPSNPKEPLKIK